MFPSIKYAQQTMLVLFVSIFFNALNAAGEEMTIPFQKSVTIKVEENNRIQIDGLTVYLEDLAREVQHRLWRSYMSNGKMLRAVHLVLEGNVRDDRKKNVIAAIREGQVKTRTVLSLHKHKKKFEDISSNKQDKIRKQFPVLFQEEFVNP